MKVTAIPIKSEIVSVHNLVVNANYILC